MTREEILSAARQAVTEDRGYGAAEDNFAAIAALWQTYIHAACVLNDVDVCVTASDVAVMMALLKIARIAANSKYADSWVDACGYLACGGELAT